MAKRQRIIVVGAGHVGLAYGKLLAEKHDVTMVDIDEEKVKSIRICDNIKATTNRTAYYDADLILIAVPTNYDEAKNGLNCDIITTVLKDIKRCDNGTKNVKPLVVIKSTVYIGYTDSIRKELNMDNVIFSPEFLRENCATHDIAFPSRIVVGCDSNTLKKAKEYAKIMASLSSKKKIPTFFTSNSEAEAIKLFSNAYLATRLAFFNELDTFASTNGMNSRTIIEGVCADSRIGDYYNTPSFGFGGYCLPKDTKQLNTLMIEKSHFKNINSSFVGSAITANTVRMLTCIDEVVDLLKAKDPSLTNSVVGIYRLNGLHNSIMCPIMKILRECKLTVIIYEPNFTNTTYENCEVVQDLKDFKERSTIIMADRIDFRLSDVMDKVFTKDQKHD